MKKRICMFSIGDLYGKQTGGIKRFKELYFSLKRDGHDVDLFCATQDEILKQNGMEGKATILLQGKSKGFLGISSHAIYLNNKEIYKTIKTENYDCVISFDVPSTIGLCLERIPNVYYFVRQDLITYRKIQYENLGMNSIKKYILLAAGWLMEGICASRSKTIVSQCKYDVNQMISRHKLLKNKILDKSKFQINNINPSWINANVNSVEEENKEYDLIYVGNFDDTRKGYKLFLDAIDILTKKGIYFRAVMLGDGNYLELCRQKYKNNGLLELPGFVVNPSEYLCRSKLMVVPSYADSCPNTIMESLLNGIPVIGAKSSGIPEILLNNEWMFELKPECLAEKIVEMFSGDNLVKCAKGQAVRSKELTFDWGKAIEQLL